MENCMSETVDILHEAKRLRLLAAALELQHYTNTASTVVPIPGSDFVIAIGPPAQVRRLLGHTPGALLKPEEIAALRRFDECAQDGEGYDVAPEMMARLAEIGVVRRLVGRYFKATEFGVRVLEGGAS
jgi:hypothetical protein